MSVTEIPILTDEERAQAYAMLREAAMDDAASAGLVFAEGQNPYEQDWDLDLDPGECPDKIDAEVVSATLVVGKPYAKDRARVRESTLRRIRVDGPAVQQMREASGWNKLRESYPGSPDPFAYGNSGAASGGLLGQYTPLWPGPVTRQLYWQDYWAMSAKAFEAYNHDPISWRCIHMKEEFALGRGLDMKITRSRATSDQKRIGQRHDDASTVWEEFWNRNKFGDKLGTIARDYCWAGEQFLRYFKKGSKLTIRALDPATIYDLITDPEDIETVFAYHQQFQTAYQLYPPTKGSPGAGQPSAPTGPSDPGAVTKYIIRQILPQEIDHYKANCSSSERRGRSDLYPALGWIKRLRDYLTAHVVQADMLARICWDLEVAGNQGTVTALRNQLFPGGRPPAPGTVFGHNSASKLTAVAPSRVGNSSGRADPILDALVTMVSLSAGLPKDWLGFGLQNTRAGALVATEPASKSMEDLQGRLENIVHDAFERVMAAARITDAQMEVTFPSIASEDRQQKLDDLGTMRANMWISNRTAGEIAAKEMNITTYDYDAEQVQIAGEWDDIGEKDGENPAQGGTKIRRPYMLATKRPAVLPDPTKSDPVDIEPPGLAIPPGGGTLPAPGSPDGTGRTVAGGGSHPEQHPMSADGKQDIKKQSTNLRQSEGLIAVPADEYWRLVREADGRSPSRRRGSDPDYLRDADEYTHQSAEHLGQLVGSIVEATKANAQAQAAERLAMIRERKEHRGFLDRIFRREAEAEASGPGGSPDDV